MMLFPVLAAAFLTQATIVGYVQTGPATCQMDFLLEGKLYTQPHPCSKDVSFASIK
jgi:hypothetical protein